MAGNVRCEAAQCDWGNSDCGNLVSCRNHDDDVVSSIMFFKLMRIFWAYLERLMSGSATPSMPRCELAGDPKEIKFDAGQRKSDWWGHDNYYCVSQNGTKILLPYIGEPPHGDSYHRLIIQGKTIRGYIWSCHFLWSECGNYFTCDWLEGMDGHYEASTYVLNQVLRATIVVAPEKLLYRVILKPHYTELHNLVDTNKEQQLWTILLAEDGPSWESFAT